MTRFLGWSLRAYQSLLILYPDDLRRDFGAEMLEAFEHDLSDECEARGMKGVIRVWRIALREAIRIGLPAWLQSPAVAVAGISAAVALVTQSPLLIMTIRKAAHASFRPGDPTLFDVLFALALETPFTGLICFVAVYPWKRSSLVTLRLR